MKKPLKFFRFYLASLIIVSLLLSILVIYHQGVTLDEGIYLYASKLFFSGQKPYRDFFFDKLPFLLVAFGLPQKIIASGIFPGRWYAFCYHFSTLIILIYLGHRLGGARAALICGLFFGTRIFNVIGGTLVSTYPPSIFFFTLALLFIFSSLKPGYRWFWSLFCLSLAIQIRHLYLVVVPLYLAVAYGEKELSLKELTLVFCASFVVSGLWLIPIFYNNPNAYHDLYSVYTFTPKAGLAYLKAKRYWFFDSLKNFNPELISGFIVFVFYLRTDKSRFWRHPHTFLGLLSFMLVFSSLKVNYAYSAYNLVAVPSVVLLLGCSINNLLNKHPRFEVLIWGGIITLILLSNYPFLKNYWQRPGFLYQDIKNIGKTITDNTMPGDLIIAFDTEFLVETGRDSVDGFAYSLFGLSRSYSDKRCKKLHVANANLLRQNVKVKKPKLIELNDKRHTQLSRKFGEEVMAQIDKEIKKNYKLLKTYPDNNLPGQKYYILIAR